MMKTQIKRKNFKYWLTKRIIKMKMKKLFLTKLKVLDKSLEIFKIKSVL